MTAPYPHPAALDAASLLADCQVHRTRRSGPGGQHRNVTDSAVVLVHRPTGVQAEAAERRRQSENLDQAIFRLRVRLALAVRITPPSDYQPSGLWRGRCQGGRITVSPKHADFPALLAEGLDVLFAANLDLRPAADRLGCTSSQLVKLLQHEPAALELVNRGRKERGLAALK